MRYGSTWLRSLLCYIKKFVMEEFVIRVLHCIEFCLVLGMSCNILSSPFPRPRPPDQIFPEKLGPGNSILFLKHSVRIDNMSVILSPPKIDILYATHHAT